jgi:hypothetical protein
LSARQIKSYVYFGYLNFRNILAVQTARFR